MQSRSLKWLSLGAAAIAMACASHQSATTTAMVSGGDVVAFTSGPGLWMDSVGGVWVEPTGVLYVAPRGVRIVDLEPVIVHTMTDANIAAHLAAGDSLEIALSAPGASRAQNPDVRNFAQRMVNEHTIHLDSARMMMRDAHIRPMMASFDTTDLAVATRLMGHLAATAATNSPNYDRQLMGAEVAMHEHMLHEIEMFRAQASPAEQPLLRETRSVVQAHLGMAQELYQALGGKKDR